MGGDAEWESAVLARSRTRGSPIRPRAPPSPQTPRAPGKRGTVSGTWAPNIVHGGENIPIVSAAVFAVDRM